MQAPLQNNLSDPAKPNTDNRLMEFAHHLAKTHKVDAIPLPARKAVGISRHPKSDLLEQMAIWEKALRSANAIFKAVPSNDLPVSRAGEWMLDNFYVVKQTFPPDRRKPASQFSTTSYQSWPKHLYGIVPVLVRHTDILAFLRWRGNGLDTAKANLILRNSPLLYKITNRSHH